MGKWVKEHGLLLANLALFVVFFGGMILSGAAAYSEDQAAHGEPAVSVLGYLATGQFVEATFENWESEFLQMAMYVILTVFLFQKGSSESKPMGKTAPQDQDPRDATIKHSTPWPVKRGGVVLKLYEHSLSVLLLVLFLASFTLHALGGTEDYNQEQQSHGQPTVTLLGYLATSRFWFESFQNWQSEFLAVAVLVGASVYLREKGSPESKPVAEPHYETGA
jgi:glycerol uptake facilitator-like aquaporin